MNTTPEVILALDTSLSRCSAGVFCSDTKRIVSISRDMERGHAEVLIPLVEEVLAEAGLKFSDLRAITTPLGPGAFTGLRIGLSAAKALGLSLNIPVIGIGTFSLMAQQYFSANTLPAGCEALGVIIETRRTDFYIQLFGPDGVPLTEGAALEGGDIIARYGDKNILCVGDGAGRLQELPGILPNFMFDNTVLYPDPAALIIAAQNKYPDNIQGDTDESLAPIYLRGADVSVSKTTPRNIV